MVRTGPFYSGNRMRATSPAGLAHPIAPIASGSHVQGLYDLCSLANSFYKSSLKV